MNIEIKDEKVNRLLKRKELFCLVDTDGATPSRKEIIAQVAAKTGAKENLVVVQAIRQEYGKKRAKAFVKVYESEKGLKDVEKKHLLARSTKEKKKKVEAPKEEVKVEEQKEEKKKEAPAEKKEEAPKEEKAEKKEKKPKEEEAPKEEKPVEKKEEKPAEKKEGEK